MKHVQASYLKCCIAVILTAFFIICVSPSFIFADEPHEVIKVAFPQLEGYSQTDENGNRYGLVIDYLNEIAKYTGWEYEYIDTSNDTMIDDFLAGKFDIMGGAYYSPEFEKYFAYPDYNTGYSKSILLGRWDDTDLKSYRLESMNGKKIGVYDRAEENIRRLEQFLDMNNLDCTLVYYSYEELTDRGDLYPYLENGEVDLLLGNSFENASQFRVVSSFDSQPLYLVTNIGKEHILEGLNMALEKILDSNPDFSKQRYAANFPNIEITDIMLNEEEKEYIDKKGSITIAIPHSWHPMFCLNTPSEHHNGLIPDILDKVSKFSGLAISFLYTDSYTDAVQLVQQGKADVLGFYLGNDTDASNMDLILTSAYVTMNNIVVRNKSVSYPSDDLTCALLEGQHLPDDIHASDVQYYPTITGVLSAVNSGKADFACGISAHIELAIQQHHFSNLVPVTLIKSYDDLSFAIAKPAQTQLLTILNKSINNLTDEEKSEILYQNMISIGATNLSLMELIYSNPLVFIVVLIIIFMLLLLTVLVIARSRMRGAMMQSELQKAEAKSRAKGDFLSRMSHEIRTPMNAIVGLADLTNMMEDLPKNAKENLDKIRSSSHYLLSLINDILDMSRIDSGMMSITSEPFSIGYLLHDLYNMMSADADCRALQFKLEMKIDHDGLTGDAVRLRQVLTNLLSNAFKFTPAGGQVMLKVTETKSTMENATYHFQVIDNGKGIKPEDHEKIFETFEQVGTNISKSQGTGLGLPISRTIVHLMGGELALKSEPNQGSEFYFTITLPFGVVKEAAKDSKENNLLSGIHILLAEDNELNAEIAIQLLEIQGAQVEWVKNGKQAVEQFKNSRTGDVQVILMDIQMPEMNGLEAAKAIRGLDRADAFQVPIIAMTANSFQEDQNAAVASGMNGFIPKPLDINDMFHVIRSALNHIPKS